MLFWPNKYQLQVFIQFRKTDKPGRTFIDMNLLRW